MITHYQVRTMLARFLEIHYKGWGFENLIKGFSSDFDGSALLMVQGNGGDAEYLSTNEDEIEYTFVLIAGEAITSASDNKQEVEDLENRASKKISKIQQNIFKIQTYKFPDAEVDNNNARAGIITIAPSSIGLGYNDFTERKFYYADIQFQMKVRFERGTQ